MKYEVNYPEIRDSIKKLCASFPGEYWRDLDREQRYPEEFVKALTDSGFLGVLIPKEHGGSGLEISAAAAILEEVHANGCNAAACLQTHDGFGFAEEHDIERNFRETRLYQVVPNSTNLILSFVSEHMLGMPRSY